VEAFESGMPYEEEVDDREAVHIPRRERRRNIDSMDMYPRRARSMGGDMNTPSRDIDTDPHTPYRGMRSRRDPTSLGTWAFIGTIIVLVASVLLLTFVFNSATITVTPKYKDTEPISKSYVFSMTQAATGTVAYELATTTLSKTKTLALSQTKKIQAKATGRIIVYNNFDSNPQKLIKNTRFESTAGKIYRISESTVIPGMKGTTPGSVEVTVYADSYGVDYNTPATDFTLPGFKDTPRYKLFYARGNGAISGGSSGDVALVSQPDLDAAKDELMLELTKEIKQSLQKVTKPGTLPLYNAVQVTFSDNQAAVMSGQTSTYKVAATGYLALVNVASLAHALATDNLLDYTGAPTKLSYTDQLSFTLKSDATIYSDNTLDILVEGKPRIVFVTDMDDVKTRFAGKNRSEAPGITQKIASISQIEMSFFPLWLSTIPVDKDHISIVESEPKR
jgi:hypothetical protein